MYALDMHRTLVSTGKGGTGKTTTVANLGPELAYLGIRVLLVGFDPQTNLEFSYGIGPDAPTVVDALTGKAAPHDCLHEVELPGVTRGGSLHVLPSSRQLNSLIPLLAQDGNTALDRLLRVFDEDFDVALIDTQGALTPLSETAGQASDTVLFVMEPGAYELTALAERLAEIEEYRQNSEWRMQALGVVFIRTAARSSLLQEFREHLADPAALGAKLYVFRSHTRPQLSVRTHALRGSPTVLLEPDSNVGRDYRAIAREYVQQLTRLHPAP